LAYKREKLAGERPKCRLESLTADLNDAGQRMDLLESQAGTGALLMTEGLLTYLPAGTVRSIAVEAHGFRYWLLDVFSTWLKGRVPGGQWAPFEKVRSQSSLSGEAILETAEAAGWQMAANRRNLTDGFQIGHARIMRLVREAAERGEEVRREPLPADDISGVWLFRRM